MAPDNGWNESRLYVRKELDRLSDVVEKLTQTINKNHLEVKQEIGNNVSKLSNLKGKISVYGAIAGVLGGAAVAWILGVIG